MSRRQISLGVLAVAALVLSIGLVRNNHADEPAANKKSSSPGIIIKVDGVELNAEQPQKPSGKERESLEHHRKELKHNLNQLTKRIVELKTELVSLRNKEGDEAAQARKKLESQIAEVESQRADLMNFYRQKTVQLFYPQPKIAIQGIPIDEKNKLIQRVEVTPHGEAQGIIVVATEGEDGKKDQPHAPKVLKFEIKGEPQIHKVEFDGHPEIREHQQIVQQQLHRVRHLHQAAENLEQAGDHDLARALHEKAEHLEREASEHRKKMESLARELHHRHAHAIGEKIKAASHAGEIAQFREVIADLTREVHALRKEIHELREELDDDDEERERDRDRERERDKRRENDMNREEARTEGDGQSVRVNIPAGGIQTNGLIINGSNIELFTPGENQIYRIGHFRLNLKSSEEDDAVEARKPIEK